jgi:hypothetical protein
MCQINENAFFEDVDRDTSQKRDILYTFPLVTGQYRKKNTVQLVSTTTKELRLLLTSLLQSINKISESIILQCEGR